MLKNIVEKDPSQEKLEQWSKNSKRNLAPKYHMTPQQCLEYARKYMRFPKPVHTGLYHTYNTGNDSRHIVKWAQVYKDADEEREMLRPQNYSKYRSPYGIADNIKQIFNYYRMQIADPNIDYLITFVRYNNRLQKDVGWRWHKHGEYIGTQNPIREYFCDEPEIEEVVHFTIFRFLQ